MDISKLCYGCFREKNSPICPYCAYQQADEERAPIALPAGSILNGRYLLGKVLGIGGFGITYLGFDLTLEIKVAIKEYLPASLATRHNDHYTMTVISSKDTAAYNTGAERFLDEARILAKLKDTPHVVTVQNYFKENNTAYFVMEYVDGLSLKDFLKQQGGRIPYQQALSILLPVMSALREVHALSLLHRDISPDNIYISSSGQSMLLDFGAARFALGTDKSISVILKHGFAPEEQYRSHGNQGPWTDVYAMGATLYNCITGSLPPDAIERLHEDKLIPPSQLAVNLPPAIENAILQALAISAGQRFPNMDGLINALTGQSFMGQARAATMAINPAASQSNGVMPLQNPRAAAGEAFPIPAQNTGGAHNAPPQKAAGGRMSYHSYPNGSFPQPEDGERASFFSKKHLPWIIGGAVALILAIVLPIVLLTGGHKNGSLGGNLGGNASIKISKNTGDSTNSTQPSEGSGSSQPSTSPPKESSTAPTGSTKPVPPGSKMTAFESKGLGIKAQIPADMTIQTNDSSFYLKRDSYTEIAAYFSYASGGPMYTLNDFMVYQDQIVKAELDSLLLPEGWSISGSSGIDLGGLNARAVAIDGGRNSQDKTELYAAEHGDVYGCYIIVILQSSQDPDLAKHQAENKAFLASLQFSGEPTCAQGFLTETDSKVRFAYSKALCSSYDDHTSEGNYLNVSINVPGASSDDIVNISSPGKFYNDTAAVIDSFVSGYASTQTISGQTALEKYTFGANEYSVQELEFTNSSGVLIHAICAVTWINNEPYKLECAYSPEMEEKIFSQFTTLLVSLCGYQ